MAARIEPDSHGSRLSRLLAAPARGDRSEIRQRWRSSLLPVSALLFLLALGVRLLYWQDAYVDIITNNSTVQSLGGPYREEARRMRERGGLLFPDEQVDAGDARIILHPPGYSLLMAGLAASLGDSDALVRAVQVVCASIQVVLLALIAAALLPRAVAIVAGLLAALSPHLAYYSVFLSPDSLAALPILLAALLVVKQPRSPRLVTMVGAGVLVGLSCWLRSNALLLAPLLALVSLALVEKGKRLRSSLALLFACGVVIAPITIRNRILYHRFIPLSVGAGITLVEGIGEYDKEGRFGMPVLDPDVMAKDVEWSGRADYAEDLWKPDGVERDQARFAKGLEVIRSNPLWFSGVVFRRMFFMLRYNDFRFENPSFNSPAAPAVRAAANFGHRPAPPEDAAPVLSLSPSDLASGQAYTSPGATVAVEGRGERLDVAGDDSESGHQFSSAPIEVRRNTDYTLSLGVRLAEGPVSVHIGAGRPAVTLAAVRVPETRAKRKKGAAARPDDAATGRSRTVQLSFATGGADEIWVSVVNSRVTGSDKSEAVRPAIQITGAELFELGPTPYTWTRYPRALTRAAQKNIFKTEYLLPLVVIGITLMAAGRRRGALVILLAVPAYYLLVQSLFHTEYRYILAMHYFLFVCAAVPLYAAGALLGGAWGKRRAVSDPTSP